MTDASPQIGTLREGPLHAALKSWYSEPGDRLEQPVEDFVIDIVRDDLLIEIQTRGFSSMKKKLSVLLESGRRVRIVHPVATDRWIVKVSDDGEFISRRLSPKHGTVTDVFSELVSFPEFSGEPGLEIEVVLTAEEELRVHKPGKAWRRGGWTTAERRLVEVKDTKRFTQPADFLALLGDVEEAFTTADIASSGNISRRLAQQAAFCLRKMNAIESVDKVGNAVVYRRAQIVR